MQRNDRVLSFHPFLWHCVWVCALLREHKIMFCNKFNQTKWFPSYYSFGFHWLEAPFSLSNTWTMESVGVYVTQLLIFCGGTSLFISNSVSHSFLALRLESATKIIIANNVHQNSWCSTQKPIFYRFLFMVANKSEQMNREKIGMHSESIARARLFNYLKYH